ncbi:MAG: insulinase family protein [Verrucomicrobia bacterium]|nr:insulinase family protein [Verrucomicrobiota bacterium]
MNVEFEQHVLANGLRVLLSRNTTSPCVAVAVYYDVGSRNETPGRSGFAHLFEHMMFEGSEHIGKTEHMKHIANAGGEMNGSTSEERTNYFEVLPSNQLGLALWLEADRMRALNVTRENFENQRATVKEERRQSIDNQPYGPAYLRHRELALGNWALGHSVIGDMADLDAATVEDAQAFYRLYYAPNNAVLAVVGDVDCTDALEQVRRYFEAIPRSEAPPEVDTTEPEQTAEKHDTLSDALAAMPGFWLAYHAPPRRSPDSYALQLLQRILLHGRSSRLYKSLIKEHEAAIECSGFCGSSRGPDLFAVWTISKGNDNEACKTLIAQELKRVADDGVSEHEVQKAKNLIKAQYLDRIQTNLGRAMVLAEHMLYDGDPNLVNTELDRYLRVSAADIQRVARCYFGPEQRTIVEALPAAAAGKGGAA